MARTKDFSGVWNGLKSFEIDIAAEAGYMYLKHNVISKDLTEEQLESIMDNYHVDLDGHPSKCPCVVIDGICCGDIACPNRAARIACPLTCSVSCKNNPWDRKGFAVDNGKLNVATTKNKGFGLFAVEKIMKCEWLGEYRGIVVRTADDEVPSCYTYEIPICGHSLDASQQSSAMRVVNHSHEPNVQAVLVVHHGKYKVLFEATREINSGEELTVDYGWKFSKDELIPECFCEAKNCNKMMGKWIDEDKENVPRLFGNIGDVLSAQVQKLLSVPIQPRPFNKTYREVHIHAELEHVSSVVLENGHLRIISARVVECFQPDGNEFFYVVRRTYPFVKDYWLPKYLVFRHREMAEFVLMKVWPNHVRRAVLRFLHQLADSLLTTDKWSSNILGDYPDMVTKNKVPKYVISSRNLEGSFGLGMSQLVLKLDGERPPSKWGVPFLPENFLGVTHTVDGKILKALPTQELILEQAATPTVVVDKKVMEDPSLTRLMEEAFVRRVFDNTVDTLIHLMIRRQVHGKEISYQQAHLLITSVLDHLYFKEFPKDRKFLLYSHYRLAMEMHVKGSLSLLWCSLCSLPETFGSDRDLRNHYFKCHAACSRAYVCFKCHRVFKSPSSVLNHILECVSDCKSLLPCINPDIPIDLLDSMFDFTVIRRSKLEHGTMDCSTNDFLEVDIQQDKVEMDSNLNTPKEKNVLVLHTAFSTQSATIEVPNGMNLKYNVDLDFVGDLSTNNWEYIKREGLIQLEK